MFLHGLLRLSELLQEEQLLAVKEGSATSLQEAIARRDTELERLRLRETELKQQLSNANRGSTVLARMQFELTVNNIFYAGGISIDFISLVYPVFLP